MVANAPYVASPDIDVENDDETIIRNVPSCKLESTWAEQQNKKENENKHLKMNKRLRNLHKQRMETIVYQKTGGEEKML